MLTLISKLDPKRYEATVLIAHKNCEPLLSFIRSMGLPAIHLPLNLVHDANWLSLLNLNTRAFLAFKWDKKLAKVFESVKPDIVHINEHIPISAGYTAKQLKLPIVWHFRHVFLKTTPCISTKRWVVSTILKLASKVICISEPEADQFPTGKVDIVFNPLDFSAMDTARGQGSMVRAELQVEPDAYVVTAPIPLMETKGAWDFIEACGLALQLAPGLKFKFLIVGSIPSVGRRHVIRRYTRILGPREPLKIARDLIRIHKLEKSLLITGHRKDIYNVMDASDLIVFPTRTKTTGRPGFEAGGMRRPVIVTMPNTATRVVLDGITGLITPERNPRALAEGIVKLAKNRELGRMLGVNGHQHVRENFDSTNHACKVMQIYDEVLANRVGWGSIDDGRSGSHLKQ